MKILYHHRVGSKDGQYVHIDELANALKILGHDVVMVEPRTTKSLDFGAQVGLVAVLKRCLPKVLYELFELSYTLVDYWQLTKTVRRHKPDVIYERYNLYLPSGLWLKRRYKLPMLLEVNAPLYDERK
jgi:hypothetical protein